MSESLDDDYVSARPATGVYRPGPPGPCVMKVVLKKDGARRVTLTFRHLQLEKDVLDLLRGGKFTPAWSARTKSIRLLRYDGHGGHTVKLTPQPKVGAARDSSSITFTMDSQLSVHDDPLAVGVDCNLEQRAVLIDVPAQFWPESVKPAEMSVSVKPAADIIGKPAAVPTRRYGR